MPPSAILPSTGLTPEVTPDAASIASRLAVGLHAEAVYLFGSRARGDATMDSDYDFLVVVPASNDSRYARNVQARSVVGDIRVPKDIVVLTRQEWASDLEVPCSLAATVAREGIRLHG